jgi:hypothetical protein
MDGVSIAACVFSDLGDGGGMRLFFERLLLVAFSLACLYAGLSLLWHLWTTAPEGSLYMLP